MCSNIWKPFRVAEIYDENGYRLENEGIIPKENEKVLLTDGIDMWVDAWSLDNGYWYLVSGEDITKKLAWMELPDKYEKFN